MRRAILFFTVSLALWSQAQKAHVHGEASVNLALEGKSGELEFEAPAEGLVGFERAAKTAAEKKAIEVVIAKFKNSPAELFVLPAAAECKLTPKEVDLHREGNQHAEMHAHYTVACKQAPKGDLELKLFQAYPKLKEIRLTFVSESQQKSGKLTPLKSKFPL